MEKKEFKELVKKRDTIISTLNSKFENTVQGAQKELLRVFISGFVDMLQVDDNNNIASTAYNHNLLLSLDKIFNDYGKKQNVMVLAQIMQGVGSVLDYNEKYYSNFAGNAKLLPLKKRVVSNMQGWLGFDDKAANENGYLSTLVKSDSVKNQLKDLSMRAIYSQKGWQQTKEEFRQFIDGKDDKSLGALQKYYRNYTYDLYSQIDRATSKTFADDLKFEFAVYEGGLIETSRPFCEEHNGNVYHISEILKFDPQTAKQPNYNPITDLGGYACRHHLNYIPTALALILRPDAKKLVGSGVTGLVKQEPKAVEKKEETKAADFKRTIDDLAKKTAKDLEDIKRPYNTVYRDFEAKGVADAKSTEQLKSEFGRPIATKDIYKKPNTLLPDEATKEFSYIQREINNGTFNQYKKEQVNVDELNIVQPFVFEKSLLKTSNNDEVLVVRYEGKLYLMDGNHRAARAYLNGEKNLNAKIVEIGVEVAPRLINPTTPFDDIKPLKIDAFKPSKDFEKDIDKIGDLNVEIKEANVARSAAVKLVNEIGSDLNRLNKLGLMKSEAYVKLKLDYDEAYKDYKEKSKVVTQKNKELKKDGEKHFAALIDGLTQKSSVKVSGTITKMHEPVIEAFKKISAGYNEGEELKFAKIRGRASYNPLLRKVNLAASDDKYTVMHELAHSLEQNNHVMKAAVDFLLKRTAGKPVRRLNEIHSGYKSSEKFMDGGFFDEYVGKIYDRGAMAPIPKYYKNYTATEVISMGLEQMMRNPRLFYKQDKEHFELIYNLFFKQ